MECKRRGGEGLGCEGKGQNEIALLTMHLKMLIL